MSRFILKRFWYGLLVLFGVVVVVFFLFNVLPGDPARMMLGQRADIASVQAINRDLGRDKPLFIQFLNYLNDLSPISLHNTADRNHFLYLDPAKYGSTLKLVSFGRSALVLKYPYLRRSYQSKRNVSEILSEGFVNTIILALVAMAFAIIAGIAIGIVCAIYRNSFIDRIALVFSVLGMSLPSFFVAILNAWIFAFILGKYTGLNMSGSLFGVDDFGRGSYLDLKNLVLPAFTLGIRPLAIIVELTRNSLLEVMTQDYIRTAKAKGQCGVDKTYLFGKWEPKMLFFLVCPFARFENEERRLGWEKNIDWAYWNSQRKLSGTSSSRNQESENGKD